MDFLPEGVAFNKEITYLARTNFRNSNQVFGIKRKDRRQHMYLLGKSGTGKSALMGNMIVQNIWNGEGVCVIDPHGELVESLLSTIPAHRAKDVVYFNPADTDFHVGFNVLQIDDPKHKHLVAAGLLGIFKKIWADAWSARMEYVLNNAILALADTPGSTLLGIQRLLVDKDYRQVVISNVKDPVIRTFWINEYENWLDQYRNEAIAPIQSKMGQFLSTSVVRNLIGQSKSTINLFEIMNSGKILLVNVSKGRIGEDNSSLLGSMFITKLQLAAMERVRVPEDDRRDFYLFVDEFQNFVTDAFASIFSEARKYRLNLTIAHQYIAQLAAGESEAMKDALFGNVGTIILFRLGSADAAFMDSEFEPEFKTQDMVNLPNYNMYLKLMIDGVTSRPFSATTLPPFKIPLNSTVEHDIVELSRKLYSRSRDAVEREINDWSGMLVGLQEEGRFKAECSACFKPTMLPFEPDPGHTLYCKECIAKIRSGEMKPLSESGSRMPEPHSFTPLINLGIEFKAEKDHVYRDPSGHIHAQESVAHAPETSTEDFPEESEEHTPINAFIEEAPEEVLASYSSEPETPKFSFEPAPKFDEEEDYKFDSEPETKTEPEITPEFKTPESDVMPEQAFTPAPYEDVHPTQPEIKTEPETITEFKTPESDVMPEPEITPAPYEEELPSHPEIKPEPVSTIPEDNSDDDFPDEKPPAYSMQSPIFSVPEIPQDSIKEEENIIPPAAVDRGDAEDQQPANPPQKEDSGKKAVREIPEDILRKVLSE